MKHADLRTVFVYGQRLSLVLLSCYNGLTMVSAAVVFRFLPIVFRIDAGDSGLNELWFNILEPEEYGCYCALFDVMLFKTFVPCRFCHLSYRTWILCCCFFCLKIIRPSVPLTTDLPTYLWDVSVLITVIFLVCLNSEHLQLCLENQYN